jgi:AraC family transcriptional regulator
VNRAPITVLEAPRYEVAAPLTIVGLQQRYNSKTVFDIPTLWQHLSPSSARSPGKIAGQLGHVCFGVVTEPQTAPATHDGSFDYLAGIPVSQMPGSHMNELPPDFVTVTLPAQRYAIFSHNRHVSALKDTMSTIWHSWLPISGHKVPSGELNMLERYGENFNPHTGFGDIEVWVPIQS